MEPKPIADLDPAFGADIDAAVEAVITELFRDAGLPVPTPQDRRRWQSRIAALERGRREARRRRRLSAKLRRAWREARRRT